MDHQLTTAQKKILFWASFLSLAAAGVGFAFRVLNQGIYREEFGLSEQQVGQIFGAALWPIAITMIGFSLFLHKTGFKMPMYIAFALQGISAVGLYFADGYTSLYLFSLCAGLGHGVVEAVINPACAAVYPKEKTKMLAILHAAWPAGLAAGGLLIIGSNAISGGSLTWNAHALWMLIPVIAYAAMFARCVFPEDERIKANVPYIEMLREIGFLGMFLVSFLMTYEIGNQVSALTAWTKPDSWFYMSLGIGVLIGLAFGAKIKAVGQPLFFLLCLLMIPIATAELGTDGWITKLMTPVLEDLKLNPGLALVFSASIMLFFRSFAGGVLKFFSPPALLCVSGVFSAAGLFWLSGATGIGILIAFTLYAIGQTFYWPCMLGFVSERYPRGGALTLNTVSAIGLLSVGIIGAPILGVVFDKSTYTAAKEKMPELAQASEKEGGFLWMKHTVINKDKKKAYMKDFSEEKQKEINKEYGPIEIQSGRDGLVFAAWFPVSLVIAFGAIALYYRSRGGYKPIDLEAEGEEANS